MDKEVKQEQQVSETGGQAVQTAANENDPKPVRSRLRAFVVSKYPEREFAAEEDVDAATMEWAEGADKELEDYRTADEKIKQVAAEHPEIMDIVRDLGNDPNMPLAVAIIRNLDVDEFYPQEGDPDYEAMQVAHANRKQQRAEQEAYRQLLENNLEGSREAVRDYYEQNQISEEDARKLEDFIDGVVGNYLQGRITARELEIFRRAMNYDKDVSEARDVGKTEGMNAKIDAVRERRKEATDGLPAPGSAAGAIEVPKESGRLESLLERRIARRANNDSLFTKTKQ